MVHAAQAASLGPNHPDVLLTRYNLGCLTADEGDHSTAQQIVTDVHAKQTEALGPDHP